MGRHSFTTVTYGTRYRLRRQEPIIPRTQAGPRMPAPPDSAGRPDYYPLVLDHVVLTTFGPMQVSTWSMAYDAQLIQSVTPPRGTVSAQYTVPLLNLVTLPPIGSVSQTYSMRRTDG